MNQTHTGAGPAPTAEEAQRRLAEGMAHLDTAQRDGLRRASRIQAAQAAGAARERDRLAAKYGADHPRARAAESRVAAETRLSAAVSTYAQQAQATTPARVDADTWAVQGRVLRPSGEPVPGVTVSLAQPGGGWERAAGHVCTDAGGGFTLRHQPRAGERLQLVVSEGARTLHHDTRVLTPVAGTIDTRTLIVDTGAGSCPPPDGGEPDEKSVWTVRGTVTDAEGKPAGGLGVSLYDQDLVFDDRLGQTTTNAQGEYRFTYRTGDFRDLIERRPDLYLKVLDQRGQTLATAPAKVRAEAGRDEVVDVRLPKRGGGKG